IEMRPLSLPSPGQVYFGEAPLPLIDEGEHRPTLHLIRRVAKHLGHLGVGQKRSPVLVTEPDALVRIFDNEAITPLTLTELFLGNPLFGHILANADHSRNLTTISKERVTPGMKTPDRSVRSEYLFVVRKGCPVDEHVFDRSAHSLAIPRMDFLQIPLKRGCILPGRHTVDAVQL